LKQLLSISEECRSEGVDLVSLKQNVDTTLPAGRLTFQVLGAVAEFEREMLRERAKAGMAQARRSGKHIERPAPRKFHADEIGRMRLLRSQGMSIRKLALDFDTTQWMAGRLNAQNPEQPELARADLVEAIPADQGAVSVAATKAVPPLLGPASYRRAVKQLLTSVVREVCTLRSVGAGARATAPGDPVENQVGQGRPTRARSRKRRIEPRKT